MSEPIADFAVIGSTPLARLLAGRLAGSHGRSVLYVGESQSSYRLPRGLDLSVAPITRPESWAMLRQGIGETVKLIGRIAGRGAWSHVDPLFFAGDPAATEALGHMRHMALGFGIAAEPAAPTLPVAHRSGIVLRDALRLNRPIIEPALDQWLEREGVRRLAPESVAIAEDGSAVLLGGGTRFEARQAILADHDAILAHLPPVQWPALLRRHPASCILTTPARPLPTPVMLEIQSGITLLQQPEGGIAAIGLQDMATFSGRIHLLLGRDRQVEQAGQTSFAALSTSDGAPALGRIATVGADVVAGMGMAGAFLAPALARWLCGEATPFEADWFGARLVSRAPNGPSVDEFAPHIAGGTS